MASSPCNRGRLAAKAQAALRAGSPGSAWLGHALQKRVRRLSLAEVFRLEFVVSLHCAARPISSRASAR
jgi:hypothetical protein